MKTILFLFLLLPATLLAETASTSPDGKYTIEYVGKISEQYFTTIEIKHSDTGEVLHSLPVDGAWSSRFNEIAWSGDSQFLAVTFRGTKTTSSLRVYQCTNNFVKEVSLPAYHANILGRFHKIRGGRYTFNEKLLWDGNKLSFHCVGNLTEGVSNPTDNPKDWYDFIVITEFSQSTKLLAIEKAE